MWGSYDEASGPEQMKAIDLALTLYFGTRAWLAVRRGALAVADPDNRGDKQ